MMTPELWIILGFVVIIGAGLGWLTLHGIGKIMRRNSDKPGDHEA